MNVVGKRSLNKFAAVLLAVLVVCGTLGVPQAHGAGNDKVAIKQQGKCQAQTGESGVAMQFEIENQTSSDITCTLTATVENKGAALQGGSERTVVLGAHGTPTATTTITYNFDVDRNAETGREIQVKVTADTSTGDFGTGYIRVREKTTAPGNDYSGSYYASVDIDYTLSGGDSITAGQVSTMTLYLFNSSNTLLKNVDVKLNLPEKLSIASGPSSVNLGYMFIGDKAQAEFKVTADENVDNKSYPIEVEITAADSGNAAQSVKKTFYVPVTGGNGENASMRDIEITGMNLPQQTVAGEDFTLTFQVANRGKTDAKNLKVTVEPSEGVINRSKSVFSESIIAKGSTKSYSVTLFSKDDAAEKNYPIKITVEPMSTSEGSSAVPVSQYAGILIKESESTSGGGVKTPQLMVESYRYGGSYVQAGDTFNLDLGLFNTSAKEIRNVKVTMTASDGVFVPVGSSNSFYIDSIPKKGRVSRSMTLSCKKDAEQKTTSMEIEMSYEDTKGEAYTSKDTISVPVTQETKLVVDDIVAPPELYAGNPSSLSVQFYNMGKTTLSNLRVNAEGNFDTMESNSYFAGNMEAGKSDTFDFSFTPREPGAMEGRIIFTYEDASGNQQTYEKPFTFEAMDMGDMMDPGMEEFPMEEEKKFPWLPVGIGVAIVAAIIALLLIKKYRKKKRDEELSIDE